MSGQSYFDHVSPTYIENWPPALAALSFHGVRVQLTHGEVIALGKENGEWGQVFHEDFGPIDAADRKAFEAVRQRLTVASEGFPDGMFIRLGSRSPKDSWEGYQAGFIAGSSDEALGFLLDSSERVYEDFMLALQKDYSPSIYLREPQPIRASLEFRCFMHDGQLVGISQYEHRESFDYRRTRKKIEAAIREFAPRFSNVSHLPTVIFDVFIRPTEGAITVDDVVLIEINPFGPYTDPCLFKWEAPGDLADFDGSFRVVPLGQGRRQSYDGESGEGSYGTEEDQSPG